jgi:hypothetical protein
MDMAKYCKEETTTQPAMLPIPFKVGGSTTGYLKMTITTIFLGDSNEDGLTEVSGLTGLTSDHGSVREQDLEGTCWNARDVRTAIPTVRTVSSQPHKAAYRVQFCCTQPSGYPLSYLSTLSFMCKRGLSRLSRLRGRGQQVQQEGQEQQA